MDYREYQYMCVYLYIVYIEIYRVGDDRRTVNTSTSPHILVSWEQTTRVKYCYVDLSPSYEFWFAIIFIDLNVIFDLSTAIQQF